ncbi:hypothetical protein [Rhizomicrobium electricum]|jgi:hypothetical protein|uniref:Outer membrane protein assembly factor BamE n=1 Tax=Rhizomicrobium electricum TaxID=480070 RepID=A0ABN1FCD6_9PROT|nr:hypothetical protein [Rhizomicrobium electricum]NIJ49210.1 hypothetical protein [Rhizomicrobium electricum]
MKRLAIALVLLLGACTTTPQPARTPLPASPPAGEPRELIGLTGPQLQAMLGRAAFSRRENGSELWRYDSPQCRAFFFLYAEGGTTRVRHVETVPRGRTMAADPGCLSVLRGKPASPVS